MLSSYDVDMIYEDNHLLVVKKPQNMLSQADSTGDEDLLTILKSYLKNKYQKPGNVYLGLVQRLDRPAGGVMVFARTSKSASRLSEQIREHRFEKTYLAVVRGIPSVDCGRLESRLVKNRHDNISSISAGEYSKNATLDYKVIAVTAEEKLSLLEINLHTGRSHQIRLQLSDAGFPVYGDMKYGFRNSAGSPDMFSADPKYHLALWACRLGFGHPVSREWLTFCCPPPGRHPWSLFNPESCC